MYLETNTSSHHFFFMNAGGLVIQDKEFVMYIFYICTVNKISGLYKWSSNAAFFWVNESIFKLRSWFTVSSFNYAIYSLLVF